MPFGGHVGPRRLGVPCVPTFAACMAPVGAEAQTLAVLVPYFINSAPQGGENFPASATLTGGEQPSYPPAEHSKCSLRLFHLPKEEHMSSWSVVLTPTTLNKLPCISRTLELF